MCGISGIFGRNWKPEDLSLIINSQKHRGPDDTGRYFDPSGIAAMGQNRLSIIDLSPAGHQPMSNHDQTVWIVLNGEIYNYLELRAELHDYAYHSRTDTEVILAAYERWGTACLDHFIGMFAFLIWDTRKQLMFGARDRFGVKPLNYHVRADGTLFLSSEIQALHPFAGQDPDETAWANYLALGLNDHSDRTFWNGIRTVPAGHAVTWSNNETRIFEWYNLPDRVGSDLDTRPVEVVQEEYLSLLKESVSLRFRADVPVGINISGGLDSSTLLGLVHAVQGKDSNVQAFTFVTGDPEYDELPWVEQMLARTQHPSVVCRLDPAQVPDLARSVHQNQAEPFGGLPTLAYARIFEEARRRGTIVLLDGQGMDEQWAGYDYYRAVLQGATAGVVQGTNESPVRPECLSPEFRAKAEPFAAPKPFTDALRNLQYRDIRYTKIPRALRFNDRISMRSSTEMREPFLDHRLFEIALRQPVDRKIVDGTGKWMVRRIARELLPGALVEAPKRPLQTPQREWLRGPLKDWAIDCIEDGLRGYGESWLNAAAVRNTWRNYCAGMGDNSYYLWQWISLGIMTQTRLCV